MTTGAKLYAALQAEAKRLGRKLTGPEVIACLEKELAGEPKVRKAPHADAEQVYALFPKKVGRDDALRAITAALKKHPLDYLLGKTNQFRECVESWPSSYRYFADGGDRCPHPASWFNAGRHADDPREWKRHGARSAPQNKINPPEPKGWKDIFVDFTDRDKPWTMLQPAQQAYIIANLETAAHFSEPVEQDSASIKLREA